MFMPFLHSYKLLEIERFLLEGNATPHLTQRDAVKRDVRTAQPEYVFPQDALGPC